MAAEELPAAPSELALAGSGKGPSTRRYLIFSIAASALLMSSVDQTIVATALPALHRDLHAPINLTGWTITIYAFGRIIVQPLVGRIGERFGRRQTFVVSIAIFTLASLLCGLASNIYVLVGLRGLQAVGGGAFIPSATGIVADHFGKDRDRAVGLFSSITPIGAILGPIFGGLFIAYWSWRGIFLVNVPIGLILILLGAKFIPSKRRDAASRVDARGAILLSTALLAGTAFITYLGEPKATPSSIYFILPMILAICSLTLFIRHTAITPNAILPITLMRGRGFGIMNVINLLYGSAALGFSALVPLYAQNRYSMSDLAAGSLLTGRGIGMILVASAAAFALRRTGYRLPMLIGFAITAISLILMAQSPIHMTPWVWLTLTAALFGVGAGIALPAANNASLQLDPTQASAAAGLRSTLRQVGSITAVSVTTAIIARSQNPGIAQSHVFQVFGILLLAVLPLVLRVPEHRGSW